MADKNSFEQLAKRIVNLELREEPRANAMIEMKNAIIRLTATTDALMALFLKYSARFGVSYDDLLQEFQDLYLQKKTKLEQPPTDGLGGHTNE